jgi:hypothetical protein
MGHANWTLGVMSHRAGRLTGRGRSEREKKDWRNGVDSVDGEPHREDSQVVGDRQECVAASHAPDGRGVLKAVVQAVGCTYSIFLQIDRTRYAAEFVRPTRSGAGCHFKSAHGRGTAEGLGNGDDTCLATTFRLYSSSL